MEIGALLGMFDESAMPESKYFPMKTSAANLTVSRASNFLVGIGV
jgi:hypothetical protein